MNADFGFGVSHDTFWDGTVSDPQTGLCENGSPDVNGKCIQDWDESMEKIPPIMCPQFRQSSCCSWQQNYALYLNLRTLVDSFGGSTGCLACAVNLVNLWCGVICSPDQSTFLNLHDPSVGYMDDDLTGEPNQPVLQADIVLDAEYTCKVFDSCKQTAIVGASTAMQSASGLLKFQFQTGAVGHGEYFNLTFDGRIDAQPKKTNGLVGFKTEALSCNSFWHPGSNRAPFPYPPPRITETSCSCRYCQSACSNTSDGSALLKSGIPLMNGFNYTLVVVFYALIAVVSSVLIWKRRS